MYADRSIPLKKTFSKLTINRKEQFQIETSIWQNGEEQRVFKRALNDKAKMHVDHLYEYYCNSEKKENLCPVHKVQDGEVYFDFIPGKSLNHILLEKIRQGDMTGLQQLLQDYRNFVKDSCELCEAPAQPDPVCDAVFGTSVWTFPGDYGRGLNIDLCFDNIIICDGKKVVIDYEWVFDMVLPVNFVIYRSIWALYVRNGQGLGTEHGWQQLYQGMGLTSEEGAVYEKMNESFNAYVYGGETSYDQLLPQYAKNAYHMGEPIQQYEFLLQIYADKGQGYSEEESHKETLTNFHVDREIDVSMMAGSSALRVDPCSEPFICKNLQVELTDTSGQSYELKPEQTNGYETASGQMIFADEDPQIICRKVWQEEPERLHISYDIQCMLQGEELKRCRNLLTDNAKSKEGWMWYEKESQNLNQKCYEQEQKNIVLQQELEQKTRELEEELAKPLWKKILHK